MSPLSHCYPLPLAMPTPSNKVLYIRGAAPDLVGKLKAAAALSGTSLQQYVMTLLQSHVSDLERKGKLPKGKS